MPSPAETSALGGAALLPWLAWAIPVAGAFATLALAKAGDRARDYGAVAFSFLAALAAALMLPQALAGEAVHSQIPWIPSAGVRAGVLADPLAVIMANVVAWISFLIMVYSLGYMHGDPDLTRYWFLMNLFIGSMLLIVLSDNLLQLFFGWEGVGLCSYALIGFWHGDEENRWVGTPGHKALGVPMAYSPSHAGMKAFVTTRVGDISFLIGVFLIYAYSGTFEMLKLAENLGWAKEMARAGILVPAAILLFGGAVGKSAQFPLHEWLPDAMAGPTSVSALIHAATMVKAGVFLVARVGPIFLRVASQLSEAYLFFQVVAWIGVFTAFLAATQALVAKEVKKVLAYSTVSQIGYMMLALGAAGLSPGFARGYTAGFFHLMSHAVFKASLFLAAGAVIHSVESPFMDDMGGLGGRMRITFASMTLAAASLMGVPPLSGFWSKDAVLAAAIEAGQYPMFAVAAATAVLTVFYSIRMIGLIFLGKPSRRVESLEHEGHRVHEVGAVMWVPYTLLAGATLAIGVVGPFFEAGLERLLGAGLEQPTTILVQANASALPGFSPSVAALAASAVALAIGGSSSLYFYVARRADPMAIVNRSSALKAIYRFLWNRWYINPLYYRAFVYGVIGLGRTVSSRFDTQILDRVDDAVAKGVIETSLIAFRRLETGVIDRSNYAIASLGVAASGLSDRFDLHVVDGAVNGVAAVGARLSVFARRLQTGVTEQYAFMFILGAILVVLFVVFGVGGV